MKILNEIGLTFDDVLLVPRKSTIKSRFGNEIDLSVEILPGIKITHPIISANMDTVSEYRLVNKIQDLGGLGIIHRFLDIEEHKRQLELIEGPKIGCIGLGEDGRQRAKDLASLCDAFLIDVAHGHSNPVLNQIRWIKENLGKYVIAGNVATGAGVEDLAKAGADSIKIGVGPGCLRKGTRVLLSNGTYKNIEDIQIGDRVINKNGNAVAVLNKKKTGIKKIYKLRHAQFYESTYVTGDHNYWVGDLNSVSKSVLKSRGYSALLDIQSKTIPKQSKYKWKSVKDLKQDVCLMPKNIQWEIPETFCVPDEMKDIFNIFNLKPSYELGYIFGLFLGDGTATNKKYSNTSVNYQISWSLGKEEIEINDKLMMYIKSVFDKQVNVSYVKNMIKTNFSDKFLSKLFVSFGKKTEKHLPRYLLANNKKYLQGLIEGLVDSDGCVQDGGRIQFKNTSRRLIELFNICTFLLEGYFPNNSFEEPTAGGLKGCNVENCNSSYRARIGSTQHKRLTKDYYACKVLEVVDTGILDEVYDIEVDCPTHSFIANNAIVHNSLCTTRIKTGHGVPQLTALVEGRNALYDLVQMGLFKETGWVPTLIGDGGIKNSGDIVKALIAGADSVMIGSLFAGTDEAPGDVIVGPNRIRMKQYRGMASKEAQESWKGRATSVEGEATWIPYQGNLENIYNDLISGILSGMSYQDARTICELRKNAVFIRQTSAGLYESKPHKLFEK